MPTGPGQAQPRRRTCVHPPAGPSLARKVIGVQCIVDQAVRQGTRQSDLHLLKLAIGTQPEGDPKADPEHSGEITFLNWHGNASSQEEQVEVAREREV